MNGINIIMPVDVNRLPLLKNTLDKYIEYSVPNDVYFTFVTRSFNELTDFLCHYDMKINYGVVTYKHEGKYFNPALALNLGVKNAVYDNIVITCPEVKPLHNVFQVLDKLDRGNFVFNVLDEYEHGGTWSLVNSKFRGETVGMYFFAVFKKEDIETINGWDLEFMNGYAWEDVDFGNRFKRAGFSHIVMDVPIAIHQWHPRGAPDGDGWAKNKIMLDMNERDGTIVCERGLRQC